MRVLLVIYGFLFLFLMGSLYWEPLKKYHTLAKMLNSLGFIGVALHSVFISSDFVFFNHMLPAFIFCLFGDFFLSLSSADENGLGFYGGLISFTLGHIVLIWTFTNITPIHWIELIFPIFFVILIYIITRSDNFDLKGMTAPILAYGFLVVWAFIRTVTIILNCGVAGRTLTLLLGTLLFMISDTIILFIYFYKKKYWWSGFVNLLAYYSGMFLLALSIYFTM